MREVALVEDEIAIAENFRDALTKQGYIVSVFHDKTSASEAFKQTLPDLVILDISLGNEADAGFELCRELRGSSKTLPIIFLSARDSDLDTISGLRLGADDYLTKDVTIAQVTARISALFRRIDAMQNTEEQSEKLVRKELEIDMKSYEVKWQSILLDLTLTEFWLLRSLALHPGHVKSREQLMQDADMFVDDGTITSHIKRLRRKFEAIDDNFDSVETVYGIGYRWRS